jgi:tetratricopeptide (TPR) repeat protein
VLADPELLRRFVATHDPSFICVPVDFAGFTEVVSAVPEFVPVFLDDVEVLYVNQRHHPGIVRAYALRAIDPFALVGQERIALDRGDPQRLIAEARRLLEVYPRGMSTNAVVAEALNREGAYAQALPHAQIIVDTFPERWAGYALKANTLVGLGEFDQANTCYRAALRRAGTDQAVRAALSKALGLLYVRQGRARQAYPWLVRGIDILSQQTPLEDLLVLGTVAAEIGNMRQAEAVLTYLTEFRVSQDDVAAQQQLQAIRARLHQPSGVPRSPDERPHHDHTPGVD